MAVVNINGFNVGTDARVSITDAFGDLFTDDMLGHLMEFDSESEDVEVKISPITTGGIPIYQTLWNGVRGSMMFTRFNGAMQSMIMELMSAYYTGGLIQQMTGAVYVRNRDNSIDEYLYSGLQISRPRFGNFRSTKEVDMRFDFRAGQVVGTGTLVPFLAGLVSAT